MRCGFVHPIGLCAPGLETTSDLVANWRYRGDLKKVETQAHEARQLVRKGRVSRDVYEAVVRESFEEAQKDAALWGTGVWAARWADGAKSTATTTVFIDEARQTLTEWSQTVGLGERL